MLQQAHTNVFERCEGINAGILDDRIRALESSLSLRDRNRPLNRNEMLRLQEVIIGYSCKEDWDSVINCASLGIMAGAGKNSELWLYRAWVEALRENSHVEALLWLSSHLQKRRPQSVPHLALCVLCNVFAGKLLQAKKILNGFSAAWKKHGWVVEAQGVFQCEQLDRAVRVQGLSLIAAVARDGSMNSFFAAKNYLNYALESEMHSEALNAAQLLVSSYPAVSEVEWMSGMVAIDEGRLGDAAGSFASILSLSPNNSAAVIALARALELNADLMGARKALIEHAGMFDRDDYEYNVTLGLICKNLYLRYRQEDYLLEAKAHLKVAARAAHALGIPSAALYAELKRIAGFKVNVSMNAETGTDASNSYWFMPLSKTAFLKILSNGEALVSQVEGVAEADFLFISSRSSQCSQQKKIVIDGIVQVLAADLPHDSNGSMMLLGETKIFENPVEIELAGSESLSVWNALPVELRSRCVSVHAGIAEEVISLVESRTEEQSYDAMQTAV